MIPDIFSNSMDDADDAQPVVEDADLPQMDDVSSESAAVMGEGDYMDPVDDSAAAEAFGAALPEEGDYMEPFTPPEEGAAEAEAAMGPPPEQAPQAGEAESEEQYVRLRMRVADGEITVVGVHVVDGPLLQPDRLHAGLAYEVNRGQERLLGLGTIPDAGIRRGFPPPDSDIGHSISVEPSFEFTARIPRAEFTREALPELDVTVYRIKGEAPAEAVSGAELDAQFDALRPVARLRGLESEALAPGVEEQLEEALR